MTQATTTDKNSKPTPEQVIKAGMELTDIYVWWFNNNYLRAGGAIAMFTTVTAAMEWLRVSTVENKDYCRLLCLKVNKTSFIEEDLEPVVTVKEVTPITP